MTEEIKNKRLDQKYASQNKNKTKAEFVKTHPKKSEYHKLKHKLKVLY